MSQANSGAVESAIWTGSGLSEGISNDCLRMAERRREVKSLKSTILEPKGRRTRDTLLGDAYGEGMARMENGLSVGALSRRTSAGGDG